MLQFFRKGTKMKYILGATLLAFGLMGCNSNLNNEVSQEKVQSNAPAETQVIYFNGTQDLTIELKSSDNFETAEMVDNSDTVYHLKRAVSGSGILLSNDDGVSIHFKGGEGVLELVKDQPINITEFKK